MKPLTPMLVLAGALVLTASPLFAAGAAPVLSSSVNPSTVGDAVTFEVNYDFKLEGGPDLQFMVDGTVVGTVPPGNVRTPNGKERGRISFTTSNLTAGTHTITVQPDGGWSSNSVKPNSLVQRVFFKKITLH